MAKPLKLSVIYGSTRPGRLCDAVAGWALGEVRADGRFAADVIDPIAADFPEDADALARRLAEADAFLVVTPEYNHSYPAPLKALIDSVYGEWSGKPVAFVSYGGASGGLRAVEHLRQVFAELDAHGLRETVALPQAWGLFVDEGAMREPERWRKSVRRMLERLSWWADALKAAREADVIEEAAA